MTFKRLSSVANVQASPAGGKLHSVVVNKGVATAVINVYNGTTTADPQIASIDGAVKGTHDYKGIYCPKGIFVDQITAAADVTICYE
jgi:hypothetical protein